MSQDVQIHTAAPTAAAGHAESACGCAHETAAPVMDVRPIPHAVRHGAVFGAVAATPPGSALVIIAPHNPLPLLAQLGERFDLEVAYLKQEPEEWHVQLLRVG